jgi:hypothetical protein
MTIPQTESFVPLMPAMPSGEKREFQIRVIPQREQPQPFQSLPNGTGMAGEKLFHKKNCEPHLSVQRDGDRISSIRIQCNCGQTIDLACLYEPPASA